MLIHWKMDPQQGPEAAKVPQVPKELHWFLLSTESVVKAALPCLASDKHSMREIDKQARAGTGAFATSAIIYTVDH